MLARYILASLAVVFLGLAVSRSRLASETSGPQARTWLMIGVLFAVVSGWLFYQG